MVVTVPEQPAVAEPAPPPPAPRFKPANLIAVVAGDTLIGIARRYGVSTRTIIALNGLEHPYWYWLRTGQRLRLAGDVSHVAADAGGRRAGRGVARGPGPGRSGSAREAGFGGGAHGAGRGTLSQGSGPPRRHAVLS